MNRARFARSGPGVDITIDLDASLEGADEFVAAITAAVARFAARGTTEAPEAPLSSRSGLVAAPLSDAERARRYRQRHGDRHGGVTNPVTVRDGFRDGRDGLRDGLRDGSGVAPASLSGSLPSLSPAFSSSHRIESESARAADRHDRHVTAVTVRDGLRDGLRDGRDATAVTVDLDQEMPDWGHAKIATLNMNLGRPRSPIDFKAEWVGFVAHIGALAASGSPRRVCEAEWQGWLRRTWDKVRATAERPKPAGRPGNRVIQEPLPEQAHIFNFDDPSLDEARRVARAKREADNAPPSQKPTERKAPR